MTRQPDFFKTKDDILYMTKETFEYEKAMAYVKGAASVILAGLVLVGVSYLLF